MRTGMGALAVLRSCQGLLRVNAALDELAATCLACHDANRLAEP